jgi:2'-5' RNA ligase
MQNVGFTDEVSDTEVELVLDAARRVCAEVQPFQLAFDAVEVRDEAVAFRPSPPEPVARVREAVREAIQAVRGAVPEAPEHAHGFQPHVSLAYSNREIPSDLVADLLKSVQTTPAIVRVRAAKLIILDRDERVYRWETYGTVPLGATG